MPPIHRHNDARSCGATTTVTGQSTVYSNSELVSVNADPNSHGGGALSAACDAVYVNSKLVVNHSPDGAAADALCPPLAGAHCAPATAAGSHNVFVGDGGL